MDPPLAPAVRGLGCPLAPPSDHWLGGLGVSLGNSEAWKPQKVGGCGWTRCPRNRILSHVAQDTARSWFRGVGAHCAVFGAFWRLFGPFLGHIVDLKGTRGLFDTAKSSCMLDVATFPFVWAFCPGLRAILGEKGYFWPKTVQIWEGTSRFGASAGGANGEFLAQNLDLPRPPPSLEDG